MKKKMLQFSLDVYKNFLLRYKLHRFIPSTLTNMVVTSHFKDKVFEVDGHKMFLNQGLFNLSLGRPFEPLETEIVKKYVKKGNVVLDIGANIGYYTLIFAELVGEQGEVYAFEPSPENFSLLERNIKMNALKNVTSQQFAISNRSGKTRLYLSSNPGDNRIYDAHDGSHSIEVVTVRLDDYFNDYNKKIDFIKMDIQGAEWAAIQGMSEIINKNRGLKILMEYSPNLIRGYGAEPADLLRSLIDQGFILYNLNEEEMKVQATDLSELSKTYPPESDVYTNYTNLFLTRDT
jgi:FkbM family methyltransferase